MALESTENATNSINGDPGQYWDFRVGALGPSAKFCAGFLPRGGRANAFVRRQFEILKKRACPAATWIAFDDIDFARSRTRMHEARTDIAATDEIVAAVEIERRLDSSTWDSERLLVSVCAMQPEHVLHR